MNRSRLSVVVTAAAAAAAFSFPRAAIADERTLTATTTTDGYGYHFDDDLMGGSGLKDAAPRLHVVQHAVRTVLIRPRTEFIREMLKSVENL
jgi:hypothetical protein